MALTPVFVTLVYYHRFGWALLAFFIAGITDCFDGLIARRFNQNSQLGRILDPIADKLLLVTAFVVMSLRSMMPVPVPRHLPIPFWVTAAVISRDVFIIVGASAINVVTGFRGFRPSWPGKLSTVVQIFALCFILTAANYPAISGYLPTVYTTVFAFAVISGLHYVFFVNQLMSEERKDTPQKDE
jgi:cardiolipin synthase